MNQNHLTMEFIRLRVATVSLSSGGIMLYVVLKGYFSHFVMFFCVKVMNYRYML